MLVTQERGTDGKEAHEARGRVQGPGGLGCPQGGSDRQRACQQVRRASDADPWLEEATTGRSRERLRRWDQGSGSRLRWTPGGVVRTDRPAQDGAGVAQKKSCRVRLTPGGHSSIPAIPS